MAQVVNLDLSCRLERSRASLGYGEGSKHSIDHTKQIYQMTEEPCIVVLMVQGHK